MRGVEKRVIYLKNTGSALFDEAYFIIKGRKETHSYDSLIAEANRIINENISKTEKKGGTRVGFRAFLLFALGAFFSSLFTLLLPLFAGWG